MASGTRDDAAAADVDAIVVGAGICGACAAHFLAERGLRVTVVDRTGVARETSSRGEGLVLMCDKPPGPERELARHGRELWVRLGDRFPRARVTVKDALMLDTSGATGGRSAARSTPDAADASALEPALAGGVTASLHPGELQVDAVGLCESLLESIAVVAESVAAVQPGSVTLASGHRLAAEHVIVACGPWSAELTGLPVQPRKGQMAALSAPPGMLGHELIEASYVDSIADADPDRSIATVMVQSLDGDEILVGSSRERVGFDATVQPDVIDALLARAASIVPQVAELELRRTWCGFRPWLPDHLPAIGPLGDRLWTSTGHEGAGVGLGPISGLLLAQLICGEPPLVDPTPFHPRRFARPAGGEER